MKRNSSKHSSQTLAIEAGIEAGNTGIDRRRFVGTAATVLAAAGIAGIINPARAYAVTSAEKQAEADAVRRRLDDWEVLLDQYTTDYYQAIEAHDQALLDMQAADERLGDAIERQAALQDELSSRVRRMYKEGEISYLSVFFGAHSLSELSSTWDFLNRMNQRDAELASLSQAATVEADQARIDYMVLERLAAQKLIEAEEIKQDAEALVAAYTQELEQLEAEVARLIEEERRAEEERRRQEELALGANPGGHIDYDGSRSSQIVEYALSRLGCPYVWAASGPNSFDCSGLTSWCYAQAGLWVPRGGNAQYLNAPMRHSVYDAEPGDILYKPGHVGLYIGNGQFIHAPNPSTVVRINNVEGYGWIGAARWG